MITEEDEEYDNFKAPLCHIDIMTILDDSKKMSCGCGHNCLRSIDSDPLKRELSFKVIEYCRNEVHYMSASEKGDFIREKVVNNIRWKVRQTHTTL
jgi:hypothetical protein